MIVRAQSSLETPESELGCWPAQSLARLGAAITCAEAASFSDSQDHSRSPSSPAPSLSWSQETLLPFRYCSWAYDP